MSARHPSLWMPRSHLGLPEAAAVLAAASVAIADKPVGYFIALLVAAFAFHPWPPKRKS